MRNPKPRADEVQLDLDEYLVQYNNKRPPQDRKMKDQTPYTVFTKGLPKPPQTENKIAAESAA